MPYQNGVVSVGTTATLIATPGSVPDNIGVLIQNLGTGTLYIGAARSRPARPRLAAYRWPPTRS
jgi:hypothetical protein